MKKFVGVVEEIWRYPVKSMGGEIVKSANIDSYGLAFDRCWAIRDETINELTTVRKIPSLLKFRARYKEELMDEGGASIPHVEITTPDGNTISSTDSCKDKSLSDHLKKSVSLWPLQPVKNWRFYKLNKRDSVESLRKQFNMKEGVPDLSSISWRKLLELSFFATPVGRFYDVYPLHILTSNSLHKLKSIEPDGDFNPLRFRPNLFIRSHETNASFDEFGWVGGRIYIGSTVIKCESRTVRCLMPSQPQSSLRKDSKVLRTLEKHTARHLGINASVIKKGAINEGDEVYWEPESRFSVRKLYTPLSNRLKKYMISKSLNAAGRSDKKTSN